MGRDRLGRDGRNESRGKFVLWAPVDREGMVRRVCVPRQALGYQPPIYGSY